MLTDFSRQQTMNYRMNSPYPPMNEPRRRKGGGCSCDQNYAKSLQGICKVIVLLIALIAFIVVGASPYWKGIFVLEGVTWPFHVVMLLTIVVWIATAIIYGLFVSGQHLEYPHIAWPRVELIFNIVMAILVLIDLLIEGTNVWRWDMSNRNNQYFSSNNGGPVNPYYSSGGSLTSSINLNVYCQTYPTDCRDYLALITGHNSYHGNHIFACILLCLLLLAFLVASWFSYRTWRVFKREMTNKPAGSIPKPSAWEKFKFRMSEMKAPNVTATNIRERFNNLLHGNRNDVEEEGHVVDMENEDMDEIHKHRHHRDNDDVWSESEKHSHHSGSKKSHHSMSTSHHGSGTRSSHNYDHSDRYSHHGSSRHGDDRHSRHGDDRRSEMSYPDSRSPRSGASSKSSYQKSHHSSSNRNKSRNEVPEKERLVIDAKNIANKADEAAAPVASVMC